MAQILDLYIATKLSVYIYIYFVFPFLSSSSRRLESLNLSGFYLLDLSEGVGGSQKNENKKHIYSLKKMVPTSLRP